MDLTSEHNAGTSTTGEYYAWQPDGHPISVHLQYSAIDKLTLEVMRGFGSIPRRGAEVGGLLLGSSELIDGQRVIYIRDFHPVACEHSKGPSFLLSDKDYENLDAGLELWRPSSDRDGMYIVGFYRSHTRDGLSMVQEDINIFDAYLPENSGTAAKVLLLIKPYATRVSVGAFFFREDGVFERTSASYLEFPFRRKELGGGTSPTERLATAARFGEQRIKEQPIQFPQIPSGDPDETPPQVQKVYSQSSRKVDLTAPNFGYDEKPVVKQGKFKSGWVWIPLSAIFLFMGVLLGFQTAINMRPRGPAAVGAEVFQLSLTAIKSSDTLNVTWDRQAPAIRTAGHGVLYIKDGDFNKSLNLDASELQVGSVVYRKPSGSVLFKLEVYPKDRTAVSETVEYREAK